MLNTTGPIVALYKVIIACASGYRNQHHGENVCLGQARKRAQVEAAGEHYQQGRWPTDTDVVTRVRELAGQELSRWQIAAAAVVSVATIRNYLKV